MGLIPDPGSMMSLGATRALRGLRTGDQRTLFIGAAMAAFGWYRRSKAPKRELLRRIEVPEGTSLVIRSGSDQAPIEVRRADVDVT